MAAKSDITPELIRQLIRFDSSTGDYYWLPRLPKLFKSVANCNLWNVKNAGKLTFITKSEKGYLKAAFFGKSFRAHRVIWAYHYGEWPTGQIDHINGNRSDNRIENLRDVSHIENQRNMRRSKANVSGVTGVHWDKPRKKWKAVIGVNRVSIIIGRFDAKSDAIAARKAAETKYGYHENHGSVLSEQGL